VRMRLQAGDVVAIDTPGGGGYGHAVEVARDA
jgi:N-methylhydantoinase B/oxoprolinase/acetone carboxylase alpha subunit